MPFRDWRLRLQDILESISEIEQRTKGITFEQFAKNQTTVKAVLYDFIIIGEATRNVSKEIQSRYPLIPWRLMGGMRNVATHEYFQVNLSRVWATIQEDLPTLVPQQTEMSLVPIYKEMPNFVEVYQTLKSEHFAITGIFPVSRDKSSRIIEFDCIMINENRQT